MFFEIESETEVEKAAKQRAMQAANMAAFPKLARQSSTCRCKKGYSPFMNRILRELAEDEEKKRRESIKRKRLASKKHITVIQRNGVSIFIHTGFRDTQ